MVMKPRQSDLWSPLRLVHNKDVVDGQPKSIMHDTSCMMLF